MENTDQFANGREYNRRLLQLARRCVHGTAPEPGPETAETGSDSREDISGAFRHAYEKAERSVKNGVFLPLEYLFSLFECDCFERHAVTITLLSELVPETASEFARINQDHRAGFATPVAVCRTFEPYGEYAEKYAYFTAESKLARFFFSNGGQEADERLTLDRRILEWTLTGRSNGSYYAPAAELWNGGPFTADQKTAARLGNYIRNGNFSDRHTLFNLYGETGGGRKSCIKQIAVDHGLNLMFLNVRSLLNERDPISRNGKIVRECMLFQAVPVLTEIPSEMNDGERNVFSHLIACLKDYFEYSFAVSERQLMISEQPGDLLTIAAEIGSLSLEEALLLWEQEGRNYEVDRHVRYHELASEFILTPGKIKSAFRAAAAFSCLYGCGVITMQDLKRGCYNTLRLVMGNKAVKLDAGFTWEDLVLPETQKSMLMTACNQVRYRYDVYQKWGFQNKVSYGRSVSMVFTGPPGTGKTMAAQVVSNELGLDIYKIELATVVSKYVGETEKNLDEIFSQAKKSQVILFFDEADVLFSKRTEVKDANDKYSNMEAAFLLQKMEEYDGITILATNYIQNFDEAFKRRIKFVIEFPFPNEKERLEIWHKVFPDQLPLGELDYEYLTSKFELSGSNIKNIALHGAFLAAADGSRNVEMKHILAAIRNEFTKSGKMFTREDAGQYYVLL